MADSELVDLSAASSLDDADLLYVVQDPAGTPTNAKLEIATLREILRLDPMGSLYAGIDNRYTFAEEYGPDEGYDLEFDRVNVTDNDLPAGLSWLNQDAAVYREALGQGRIDWGGGGDASNIHAVVQALPATTTFEAWTHLQGMSLIPNGVEYLAAFTLYNSANGDFVFLGMFQVDPTPAASTTNRDPTFFVTHYTDADTSNAAIGGPIGPILPFVGPHCYYRIRKNSDTSYDFFVSPDGGCWFTVAAAVNVQASLGADPTHIGWALNTTGGAHVGCEWIRIRNVT